jgi:hypothetical protein
MFFEFYIFRADKPRQFSGLLKWRRPQSGGAGCGYTSLLEALMSKHVVQTGAVIPPSIGKEFVVPKHRHHCAIHIP